MASDYQVALIRRIKSRLRQEAGVPSFDPSEPCPQSEPTLEEVVAGNDPSPLQLRCRKCRGRLLGGIRSHVCIYCGAQQRSNVSPPRMSFTSTFAYRGLLRSLQLDGSEIVSPDINTEHSIGHHATTKKDILLSELLDFELKWPQVTEVTDDNHENMVQFPHTNHASLTNVNLENFFSTISKPEIVIDRTNGQSTSDPSNEMIGISSKEFNNFEAFDKIGDKGMVDINGANDSSWKAEFQRVASGSQTTDANVIGFLSPTVTNFVSTSNPIGEDLSNVKQFARENKNKVEETNEPTHLPSSVEQRPHNVMSDSVTTENKSANQSKEGDDSVGDWQDFSGPSHLFSDTKGYSGCSDETFESDVKVNDCTNQTEEDDDWQDFTGSADTPSLASSLCALSGGAFSQESTTQVNSIDVDHENVWRTIGGGSSNVLNTAADSLNNSEGCNHLNGITFTDPESDAFMGENPQEGKSDGLIRQTDKLLDDWQEFTSSGDMFMLSSDAWPLDGPAISQKPTEVIGSCKLVHGTETISESNDALQIISDAGSKEIEQRTADLKDNIETNHSKSVAEDTETYKADHLMKTSGNSVDDQQHFAGSRDMPMSSVWPLIGSTVSHKSIDGGEVPDLVLERDTSNKNCETVSRSVDARSDGLVHVLDIPFQGSSGNHNTSDQTYEGNNSYDAWHDHSRPRDPLGVTSSTWPLAGSAVEQESARKSESTNIVKGMESIDRKCAITPRTIGLESSSAAKNDVDSTSIRESNQSTQLSFYDDQFDAFFGKYSQKHSSNQPSKEINDPLDDWQDFTGSGGMQEPSPSVVPNAEFSGSRESINKAESTHILQDIDFIKHIHSEPFSTDMHLQKSSINLSHMSPVPSFSNRVGDTGGIFDVNFSGEAVFNHADDTSGVSAFDPSAVSTAADTREKVNVLTSEMHDLSFMLNNELSLPVKHKNSG